LEIYFYAIFTFSILVNQRLAPIIAGSVILGVWFGLPYITDNKAALFYYTNSDVKYFVVGIAIWYLFKFGKLQAIDICLPKWIFPALLVTYALAVVIYAANPAVVVPVLFFAAIFSACCGADLQPRAIMLMGDASYACYLLHTILIEVLRHLGFAISGTILFTLGVLVGSWIIAIAWHITVEKMFFKLRRYIATFLFAHRRQTA
jgi:exopolysaccharide production protein ExoZ